MAVFTFFFVSTTYTDNEIAHVEIYFFSLRGSWSEFESLPLQNNIIYILVVYVKTKSSKIMQREEDSELSSVSTSVSAISENLMQEEALKPEYFYTPRFQDQNLLQKTKSLIIEGEFEISPLDLKIGRKIGEGAFGVVNKGKLRGATCVVKMLREDVSTLSSGLGFNCLLMEIGILAGIGPHPNLVAFYGACLHDVNTPMIVQEYIEGPNLQEHLDNKTFGFNLGHAKVLFKKKF